MPKDAVFTLKIEPRTQGRVYRRGRCSAPASLPTRPRADAGLRAAPARGAGIRCVPACEGGRGAVLDAGRPAVVPTARSKPSSPRAALICVAPARGERFAGRRRPRKGRGEVWRCPVADNPRAAARMDELFGTATGRLANFPRAGRVGKNPGTQRADPHDNYCIISRKSTGKRYGSSRSCTWPDDPRCGANRSCQPSRRGLRSSQAWKRHAHAAIVVDPQRNPLDLIR